MSAFSQSATAHLSPVPCSCSLVCLDSLSCFEAESSSRRGGTGFVQEAVDTATGQHVAVKFIPRVATGYDPAAVSGELLNQRLCAGHPNIIQLQVSSAPLRWPHSAVGLSTTSVGLWY
jgi:hypothetical protein